MANALHRIGETDIAEGRSLVTRIVAFVAGAEVVVAELLGFEVHVIVVGPLEEILGGLGPQIFCQLVTPDSR
jgi:hypothetical protein